MYSVSRPAETTRYTFLLKASDGIVLLAIFGIALALRVIPSWDVVFGGGWTNFQGNDSWYHIRLIENLLQHFPSRIAFDPYTYFPYGQDVFFAPLFDLMIGSVAWLIGLGSPGQNTVAAVAAFFPPVLGALTAVPVYFIGKLLFDRKAGLLAALLVVILPSAFLMRSRLGFVDHHVAEVLFSTTAVLFLMLAVRRHGDHPVTFADIKNGKWKLLAGPGVPAVLAGIALGAYLLTWVGGLLFVFIIFCWTVLMFLISHFRHQNTDYLVIYGLPVFLIPLLLMAPFLDQIAFGGLNIVSLVIAAAALPLLNVFSRLLERAKLGSFYYPLLLAAAGGAALLAVYLVSPDFFRSMIDKFAVFTPNTTLQTISEARPLFYAQGPFSFKPVWDMFTTGVVTAPIAFFLLLLPAVRKTSAVLIFFLVWCLLIFLAAAGQVRFAEYLTVPIALLSACLCWRAVSLIGVIFKWLDIRKPAEEKKEKSSRKKKEKSPQRRFSAVAYYAAYALLAVPLIFFLSVFPNISPARAVAAADSGVDKDWYRALVWMRTGTPEPFGDSGYFNELYQKPAGGNYSYPDSAYGVMAWWTRGHIITQIAHRIPNSNPHQYGAPDAARYFTADNEQDANRILDRLGSKYVIVDLDLALPFDKNYMAMGFPATITWAGYDLSRFCDIYFQEQEGTLRPVTLFYPEYYRCFSTRLYGFGGQEVVPVNSTLVVSWENRSGRKVITSSRIFRTYEEARDFIGRQTASNFRIAGTSPFISPVPLEKLEHYEEVYRSEVTVGQGTNGMPIPSLRIFEYRP